MDISTLTETTLSTKIDPFRPGDTVKVTTRVMEGEKERLQVFQGVVLKINRGGVGATFTVRRISYGIGVEKGFPLYSPSLEKVEVIKKGDVRRARLYYLRHLSGKAARIKEKAREVPGAVVEEEAKEEATEAAKEEAS